MSKSILDFLIRLAALTGVAYGCYAALDAVLTADAREECWRLERQHQQGYIQAIPAWCAEVP